MRSLSVVLLLFLSLNAWANEDCYQRLTDSYSYDSNSFNLYIEDHSELDKAKMKRAVTKLYQHIGCNLLVNQDLKNISCRRLFPAKRVSKTCYGETQRGYFILSQGMMGNIIFNFHRWD